MKVLIIDPSGKVPLYDNALCNAISNETYIEFASPYDHRNRFNVDFKFIRLVHIPNKWRDTTLKRLKPIEGLVNYMYISLLILFKRYDIVHFQWLPFLEYIGIEKYFLKLFKLLSPNTRYVLTQHNLYPHNSSDKKKLKYYREIQNIKKLFSHFIVHTEVSKESFCKEYDVSRDSVSVIHHGIFKPRYIPERKTLRNPKRLLVFGLQTKYKGTDILIDAISLLHESIRQRILLTIAGKTDTQLYNDKLNLAENLGIVWINRFLTDDELNQLITDSDVLLLPYRAISQSGVLLLSLTYNKHLIVSDLQSFRETLQGYPDDCFFKVGSAESLAEAITLYIEGKVDLDKEKVANNILINKYSWEKSAKKTIEVYHRLFQQLHKSLS